jgi:citrate lyase subunit beta / citryl-CoA lyase
MISRPLRSVLYMPGSNQRAMDKARSLAADAIVFDLEDAVAPDAKVTARELVAKQLAAGGYGQRQLVVRANSLDSPWGEADIRMLVASSCETLCLPKIETPAQLQLVADLLAELGRTDIGIWAMIETPAGVKNAESIAGFAALSVLVMGTTDLASELRVPHRPDRLGLQYALSQCVLAARCAGKAILDGVYLELDNSAGLQQACEQGHALGFDGKTLIHPAQIATANTVFGFSEQDVQHARRVLEVWEQAEQAGKGVAVLDGKLVEIMHVGEATRLLELAEWVAQLESGTTS